MRHRCAHNCCRCHSKRTLVHPPPTFFWPVPSSSHPLQRLRRPVRRAARRALPAQERPAQREVEAEAAAHSFWAEEEEMKQT